MSWLWNSSQSAAAVDQAQFSRQVKFADEKKDGETRVFRALTAPDFGLPFLDTYLGARTVHELLERNIAAMGHLKIYGTRITNGPYEFVDFATTGKRRTDLGSGLLKLTGLKPATNATVGLLLKNCFEWVIIDFACASYSLISVPVYETFDDNSLLSIYRGSEITVMFLTQANLATILKLASSLDKLKFLIVIDKDVIAKEDLETAAAIQVTLVPMKEVEELGRQNSVPHVPPKPDDILTICYTSGTTSDPKGVMVSHKNIISTCEGVVNTLDPLVHFSPEDRHLSFLPMSHMFERCVSLALPAKGCKIGFFRGLRDVEALFDDVAALQPTLFPTVPRILNRLHDRIQATLVAAGFVGRTLFNAGVQWKRSLLNMGIVTRSTFWDWLIFGKVQKRLGGHCRAMLTGAAPISPDVIMLMRILFGSEVFEGYGQTECCSAAFITQPGDYLFPHGTHVGIPIPCGEAKLVDVPEMNYFTAGETPRGEVCVRGNNVMLGYWKNPKMTAETIDADGWLHTGDVGELCPNGTLKIIDRVKNLFKMSQGEYISPEKVESIAGLSLFVAQSFVHGDPLESMLVAVVYPDFDAVRLWAKSNAPELESKTNSEICESAELKKAILADIAVQCKTVKMKSFEIPKAVHCTSEEFSVLNGLLTPTLKIKRPQMKERFRNELDKLYAELKSTKAV